MRHSPGFFQDASEVSNGPLLVLCFDMDGCLVDDLFYPGLVRKHRFSEAALRRILMLVEADQYQEIVIRPGTNRKDRLSDQLNASSKGTARTTDALMTLCSMVCDLLQHTSVKISVDVRLHVTQLFPDVDCDSAVHYEDVVRQFINDVLSVSDSVEAADSVDGALYSKQAPESADKLDIVLSLAMQHASLSDAASREATVVLIDDRFYDGSEGDVRSLHAVTDFLCAYSSYIPENVTFKMLKMDPYIIKDSLDDAIDVVTIQRRILNEYLPSLADQDQSLLQSMLISAASFQDCALYDISFEDILGVVLEERDLADVSMCESLRVHLEELLFQNVILEHKSRSSHYYQCLVDARLKHLADISEADNHTIQSDMIDLVSTFKGSAVDTYAVTTEAFWVHYLIPAAQQYRMFIHLLNSDMHPVSVFK